MVAKEREGRVPPRPLRTWRAIDGGNPTTALAAARELPRLSLADSLALLLVRGDVRYPKAPARWHARFVMEVPVTLAESQLALSALALPDQHAAPALAALERLFVSFDRRDLAETLLLLSIGTNSY